MTDRRLALVVDLGTSGLKVGVSDLRGHVLWSESHELTTDFGTDGAAVQDAGDWWSRIAASSRAAMASRAFDPKDVVAVGVTGQWASTVPTRVDGTPAGPCLLWLDTRGGPLVRKRLGGPVAGYDPRKLFSFIRASGGVPSLDGADPMGHRLFIVDALPAVERDTAWFLEPVDHLTFRMTGVPSATAASMTGSWLVNIRRGPGTEYQKSLVTLAGADATRLPPLTALLRTVGTVTPSAAEQLGLVGRPAVITGLPDAHTSALGAGATADHAAHLALSTTSWISCHIKKKKTDAQEQMATIPGVFNDRYLVANNHETSGRSLAWFREVFTEGRSKPTYDELTALAAISPAGSGDVIFTPWLAGERSPVADKAARGGFHNISLTSTRADMVRAVLEGVAYNNRWLHEAVEGFVGRRLDSLRIVGGGAVSDLWCQIHADVMDRVIEQVEHPLDAGLRGAALACGLALGDINRSEVDDLVSVAATFRPNPANRAPYDRLFAEYPGIYKTQKPMFRRLNR